MYVFVPKYGKRACKNMGKIISIHMPFKFMILLSNIGPVAPPPPPPAPPYNIRSTPPPPARADPGFFIWGGEPNNLVYRGR